MAPWPRKLWNFPIIILATSVQCVISLCLWFDPVSHYATQVHILYTVFPLLLPYIVFLACVMAIAAFMMPRKVLTLILLTPQQLLLWLSAGGSFQAIWLGHYADGVIRPLGHMLADQSPVMAIAVFHSWAMFLILKYGED